jgi:hypothetical protein
MLTDQEFKQAQTARTHLPWACSEATFNQANFRPATSLHQAYRPCIASGSQSLERAQQTCITDLSNSGPYMKKQCRLTINILYY